MEKKLKEIEEKLGVYKAALSETIDQLRVKRTELAAAAKTKLSDLQKEIPELEQAISEKSKKVMELDKALADRQARLKGEEMNWKAHYEKVEAELSKSYAEKSKELDKMIAEAKVRKNQFDIAKRETEQTFNVKELALKSRESRVESMERYITDTESTLRIEGSEFEKFKQAELANLETLKADIRNKLNNAEEKIKEALKVSSDADSKKRQVDAILARVKEVESREQSVNQKEKINSSRAEEINVIAVENLAERKRLNKFRGELEEFQTKLEKRESNLKLLEEIAIKDN